jgi:hypothetical protein
LLDYVREIVIKRFGVAGAWPVDVRRPVTGPAQEIVNGRDGDEFHLILPAINTDRHARTRANEPAIEQDRVFRRRHTRNEGRVIRPSDCRIGNVKSLCRCPVCGQATQGWKSGLRIGKIRCRKSINRYKDNVIIGRGGRVDLEEKGEQEANQAVQTKTPSGY